MQVSESYKRHNKVDYFPLPNGLADVFLHRNETIKTDEEGNTIYIAEEVYFQVEQSVTKEQIEQNFDNMWANAEKEKVILTDSERLLLLEKENEKLKQTLADLTQVVLMGGANK